MEQTNWNIDGFYSFTLPRQMQPVQQSGLFRQRLWRPLKSRLRLSITQMACRGWKNLMHWRRGSGMSCLKEATCGG